jgi:long-chain acyl-CoA synthetase
MSMNERQNKPIVQRLLHDSLRSAASREKTTAAVITENNSYSYQQLIAMTKRLASLLVDRGLRRGDRVVIYADNTIECVVSIWATLWAGGVFVVVNPQTKQDKLAYIIQQSEAKILVTDEHLQRQFIPVLKKRSALAAVICSKKDCILIENYSKIPIEDFHESMDNASMLEDPVFSIPNDLAALIYTSGSTGSPKGVMMSHQSMVFARDSIIEYLRLDSSARIINFLPLAFDYGLYQLLMTVGLGATLILDRSFAYPAMILQRIRDEKATVFPGVPTVYSTLVSMYQKSNLVLESVTRVTNTAAALPPDYVPVLRRIFPNALIYAMYGLTECKRVSYLEPELLEVKRGSVGKPIPGTEMFLLSPEGAPVPPGEAGILHVRGPHVMLGYWKEPEKSAKMLKTGALPGERILCAQDWFTMDNEGFFYFQGRSDDIIKTRGEKVSPVEVENVLFSMPGIKETAVIGIPDQHLGQAIKAFIVPDAGATLSAKEVQKYCLTKLENFMIPQQIEFIGELPKTSTGKISKKDLH